MKKSEMQEVAEILHFALNTDRTTEVKSRVGKLRKSHLRVQYSFEESPAFFYH